MQVAVSSAAPTNASGSRPCRSTQTPTTGTSATVVNHAAEK